MNNISTPNTTEHIPEQMVQLQSVETTFDEFLSHYQLFFNDYQEQMDSKDEPDFQKILDELSNDDITVTYRKDENMEGSFYFKDNKTADEVRFRGNEDGHYTYLRDAEGKEELFLHDLNPKKDIGVLNSLSRIQGGKNVISVKERGINTTYQTPENKTDAKEAGDAEVNILTSIQNNNSNIFKTLLNQKKNKILESELADNISNQDSFITQADIPEAETEAIFKRFNNIMSQTTHSFEQYNAAHHLTTNTTLI
ncbi:hypothetical protein COB57_05235 [Candidatus Peregrinibacteria bacterium]|nr:MAG: hypothetical protein COB57_05235 [Candidatus Peregrinibacteria bacterium]